VSSPTDPLTTTGEPAARAQPTTQEIPVAPPAVAAQPLPPHPGASAPAPVQTVQPTGPVGLVPGLAGQLPPPPPPATVPAAPQPTTDSTSTAVIPDPAGTGPVPLTADQPASESPTRPARDRSALVGLGLVGAALVLLELGLGLRFGSESFWSEIPLWSAFATVCAVLGLAGSAALLPGGRRLPAATGWRIAAGGLTGLAVFWVLVVLPVVASDRGFLLTAALGCLGGALWVGPARKG
jgi:hypothetical protein